jgi:cation transport ATPase
MTRDQQKLARVFRAFALYLAFAAVFTLGGAIWFRGDPIGFVLSAVVVVCAFSGWFYWRIAKALRRPPDEAAAALRPRRSRPQLLAIHIVVVAIFLSIPVATVISFGWTPFVFVWAACTVASFLLIAAMRTRARRRARA